MNSNTILLVEDNSSDEALTLMAFKRNNIPNDIAIARDGREAVDYLLGEGLYWDRNVKDIPCLIILDLKLPKMDGLAVLREIRANSAISKIPVVMLTSSAEGEDIVSAYDLGTNAYVQKPVDFLEFSVAVKHIGTFWLNLNKRCA